MLKNVKCKKSIAILSLIALLGTIMSCIGFFVHYEGKYVIGGNVYYELCFRVLDPFDILFLLMGVVPCVLLFLYIWNFHEQRKATVLYPIACGLIAAEPLLSFVVNLFKYGFNDSISGYLRDIAIVVLFTLLTVNATRGLNKKVYTILATSVCLILQLLSAISLFPIWEFYAHQEMYLSLFAVSAGQIGSAALQIVLLLFGLNNRIPSLVSTAPKKASSEQYLRFLKDQFDCGVITEEDYQRQRADIISKL